MATISEDYVSFETAKLLKEKGMDKSCFKHYVQKNNNDGTSEIVTVCTLQIAMKWLREVHNISIEITSKGYLIDSDVEWECDIKAGHRLYFKHITGEKSFEYVAEKAIKYCLENLI